MAVLPYMNRLPQDYYNEKFAATYAPEQKAPTPVSPLPVIPSAPVEPDISIEPPVDADGPAVDSDGRLVGNEGGTWFGVLPPANPGMNWLWCNSDTGVMYTYQVDSNTGATVWQNPVTKSVWPTLDAFGNEVGYEGGAWFGPYPPIDARVGWLWFNSDLSVLYVNIEVDAWMSVADQSIWSPLRTR